MHSNSTETRYLAGEYIMKTPTQNATLIATETTAAAKLWANGLWANYSRLFNQTMQNK